jgi:hypothetical protein
LGIGDLRYPGILFGCDGWGTMVDKFGPYPGQKGMKMIKLLIKPHPDLVEAYPEILKYPFLQKISTPIGNAIWMEYPLDWVDDPNISNRNRVVRIKCAFDGSETYYTNQSSKYLNVINEIRLDLEHFKKANISLRKMLNEYMDEVVTIAEKSAEIDSYIKGRRSSNDSETEKQDRVPEVV